MIDPSLIGFGILIGLSLGMTGSGGSILAIPILVYGVGLPIQQALVISLLMVASIAAFGAFQQTITKQINWRAAILFSLGGIVISPLVVSITHEVNETLRLILFAMLMLFVAWRMTLPKQSGTRTSSLHNDQSFAIIRIALGGGLAGALSGFFGVGGGFVIVPLLTLLFAMPYVQAVGTSLASIVLISTSALAGHFIKDVTLDIGLIMNFIVGGSLGMLIGIFVMNKIPEHLARLVFATITALLALFMLIDKLFLHQGGAL